MPANCCETLWPGAGRSELLAIRLNTEPSAETERVTRSDRLPDEAAIILYSFWYANVNLRNPI